MTTPNPELDKNEFELEHGLTSTQTLELFGDQGEFPYDADHGKAMAVLRRKAILGTEWLASFWQGPLPEWFIQQQIELEAQWEATARQDTKDWLASFPSWNEEEGIKNPSPLHGLVLHHFRDLRLKANEAQYDRDQEIVLQLFVNAGLGANSKIAEKLDYVKAILEAEGEATISAGFNKFNQLPMIRFPKPLMGQANYAGENDGMLF